MWTLESLAASETFVKETSDPSKAQELRMEAANLRRLAHPGIVELLDVIDDEDHTSLLLRRHGHLTLETCRSLSAGEITALGAAIATILADIHDIGASHQNLTASHVLLSDNGKPVLCSLREADITNFRARSCEPELAEIDIRALANILTAKSSEPLPRKVRQALEKASSGKLSARSFARKLLEAFPDCSLPSLDDQASTLALDAVDETTPQVITGHAQSSPRPKQPRPKKQIGLMNARSILLSAGALGVITMCALFTTVFLHHAAARQPVTTGQGGHSATSLQRSQTQDPPRSSSTTLPCPSRDRCESFQAATPFTWSGHRYEIGSPGEMLLIGRWSCGQPLPLVLDPHSGDIWGFTSWASTGSPVRGQLIAQSPGATAIGLIPSNKGCDGVWVTQKDGLKKIVKQAA